MIILPLTFNISNTIIAMNVAQPNNTNGLLRSPNCTNVTGLSTTTSIIWRPIIARNNPIPAPIPNLRLFGIELINQALIGVRDIIKNNTPATNTAPKASWGVYPIPAQTPKATNALIPIPGASPIGQVFP